MSTVKGVAEGEPDFVAPGVDPSAPQYCRISPSPRGFGPALNEQGYLVVASSETVSGYTRPRSDKAEHTNRIHRDAFFGTGCGFVWLCFFDAPPDDWVK